MNMMNEAVEAVARALCEQAGYDPDSLRSGDDPYMNNTPVNDGINAKGDTCHFRWRAYYWQAQAALAAATPIIMERAAGIVRKKLAMVVLQNAESANLQWIEAVNFASDRAQEAIRAAKTDGGGA